MFVTWTKRTVSKFVVNIYPFAVIRDAETLNNRNGTMKRSHNADKADYYGRL